MELFNTWALNIVVTALLTAVFLSLIAILPALRRKGARRVLWPSLLAVFTFSILGFVAGQIMGQSRTPVVGTIIPAVLTLLGGVAVYLIGTKGTRAQSNVSVMISCFTIAFLLGSLMGIRLRIEFEYAVADPARLLERELALEKARFYVDVQRLRNYVRLVKLRQGFAKEENIDLSNFKSSAETDRLGKPDTQAVGR
jgi:hypothetical protein